MNARTALHRTLAIAVCALMPTLANAQLFRAYLASDGSDANPCTLVAPCRLLPAALAAAAAGGEIWMLDSANYNTTTVTIGKDISILAIPGAVGSLVVTSVPAISITAANLLVSLRNVVIVPLPGGTGHGVSLTAASELVVEDSLFANLPSAVNSAVLAQSAGAAVRIANTSFRNINGFGVSVLNGATGSISKSRFLSVNTAIYGAGTTSANVTRVNVTDTTITGSYQGIFAKSTATTSTVAINVSRCTVDGSTYALDAETTTVSPSTITIGNSLISGNGTAFFVGGSPNGAIRTLGNNQVFDNTAAGAVPTLVSAQ